MLQTEELVLGYKNKKIQSDISITLKTAECVALIGRNGIGKSTLLKTITGAILPLSGTVFLQGKNINLYSEKEKAQLLSIVLTEHLPPSHLTAYEIIALGRQPYTNWLGKLSTNDKQIINQAIQLTEVAPFINKKHYELSDGQLQKVMITRALAQNTPIIILDEPTTHLDLAHKVALLKLLKKISSEANKTILYATHDLDLALQLSDKLLILSEKNTMFDTPLNCINNKAIHTIFNDKNIMLDNATHKFIVK